MTGLHKEFKKMAEFREELQKIIEKSTLTKDGNPARYHLQTSTDKLNQSDPYRKINFGERDKNKPHKTILMVGETGSGKTTLINVMINHILGVKREDKVWFEITDEKSDQTSAHSQTSIITVYGFYLQENAIDLTIIDTPGYGDTRGIQMDKEITMSFHSLSKSVERFYEIHAVCLVINATQNRLSERQIYVYDAVQSLFGKNIAENTILLFTHSDGKPPKNALTAVKEAKIKCAVNDKNQPVYFLFNNCQSDPADEEYETIQDQLWNHSIKGMSGFFKFLQSTEPKTLKLTQHVLQNREQLEANIDNLYSRVQVIKLTQNELNQTYEALKQNEEFVQKQKNFVYDVDVPYKEKTDLDPKMWNSTKAMCCTVCEENCHFPGCRWAIEPSWCRMMKNGHCTVCTNKCHYSKHVKEAKIYEIKTKKEKRTYEDLKNKHDVKISDNVGLINDLEKKLKELKEEKKKLLNEVFLYVENLETIALKTESLFILKHSDFLIENLTEINEPEKAEKLKNIKKGAIEEKQDHLDTCSN